MEFGTSALSIGICRYDKLNETIVIDYSDLDIEIYLNLFSIYNTYRLEFRKRSNKEKFKFDLVHKQYRIGYWERSRLNELFSQIRVKQGKLSNADHIL